MNKLATTPDRRQFGRRWTQLHGFVCVEGRPRMPCTVQNFSETGALLEIGGIPNMPKRFILAIDTIKFRMGCEIMRELPGRIGVKFMAVEDMAKANAAEPAPLSTYEKLLALANAEHEMAESAETMRSHARFAKAL